jgi:hypothetical protein
MKLLDAHVNGMLCQVSTKYGDKSVLDVVTSECSSCMEVRKSEVL